MIRTLGFAAATLATLLGLAPTADAGPGKRLATAADRAEAVAALKARRSARMPGPKVLAPGKPSSPIPYPSCPTGWTVKQKGAAIFTCYHDTIGMYVDMNQTYAQGFDCLPGSYWNTNASVSYSEQANSNPNGPQLYRIRWTCTKNS